MSVPRRCEGCPGKERVESLFFKGIQYNYEIFKSKFTWEPKIVSKIIFSSKGGHYKKRNFVTDNIS